MNQQPTYNNGYNVYNLPPGGPALFRARARRQAAAASAVGKVQAILKNLAKATTPDERGALLHRIVGTAAGDLEIRKEILTYVQQNYAGVLGALHTLFRQGDQEAAAGPKVIVDSPVTRRMRLLREAKAQGSDPQAIVAPAAVESVAAPPIPAMTPPIPPPTNPHFAGLPTAVGKQAGYPAVPPPIDGFPGFTAIGQQPLPGTMQIKPPVASPVELQFWGVDVPKVPSGGNTESGQGISE